MYEAITYEAIRDAMLSDTPDTLDKREGGIMYNALAPTAVELQHMYIQLDYILNAGFADTAEREFLDRRCAERGISRRVAARAAFKAVFTPEDISVPLDSRFGLEGYNYTVTERLPDGAYRLECETAGSAPNGVLGRLTPMQYIKGLKSAELTELMIPGTDTEGDESLRRRYLDSFSSEAFGGNIADYKAKAGALPGVGGVKVYPVWNGGGTVRLSIISSDYDSPSDALISSVQAAIDPPGNHGEGLGIAPIGHVVTVTGVKELSVNLEFTAEFASGCSFESAKSYIKATVEGYLAELAKAWAQADSLTVRISHIESRILELEQVEDIRDTTLNGQPQNLVLGADEIPAAGTVNERSAADG